MKYCQLYLFSSVSFSEGQKHFVLAGTVAKQHKLSFIPEDEIPGTALGENEIGASGQCHFSPAACKVNSSSCSDQDLCESPASTS